MDRALFIFRRDLRTKDNIGFNALFELIKNSDNIICIFIFTPEQINKNEYKSSPCIQFMKESLQDLQKQLHDVGIHLYFFYGDNSVIMEQCYYLFRPKYVFYNKDYTPYAIKRDEQINKICDKYKMIVKTYDDYNLINLYSILNDKQQAYQKFTSFYNKVDQSKFQKPVTNKYIKQSKPKEKIKILQNDYIVHIDFIDKYFKYNNKPILIGGRSNIILKQDISNGTQLSPYLKFGCISIREAVEVFRTKYPEQSFDLIRSLIWRDFYQCQLLLNHDYLWKLEKNISKRDSYLLDLWKQGNTGYPIVDASMRQLNAQGYIANRNRLIVSSFLINNLLLSWKLGEKYFANTLLDYDVAQNNGNWRWVANQNGTRTLNPFIQGKKYDKDCTYIKKWIPELKDTENSIIHKWYLFKGKHMYSKICVKFQ